MPPQSPSTAQSWSPEGASPQEPPRQPEADPQGTDITATFRSEVALRLRRFSILHARHAWERRRRDPLSPHGVALFYLEPHVPAIEQLRTATRVFLADDEAAELPRVLYELARHAYEGYQSAPGFDPRAEMANRHDEMSPQALFVGVGVSTLDTQYGDWSTAQGRARTDYDLPALCYARLIDGTHLRIDRGGRAQFDMCIVESSVSDANAKYGVPSMQWRWNPALAEVYDDDPTFHIWRWMGELGRIIDNGSRPR